MAFLGTVLNTLGALFLTHAVYSAHEHTSTSTSTSSLPSDITLELLFSIILLSTGIVASSQPLRPIQTAQWAGQISRDGQKPDGQYTREGEAVLTEGDPYSFLGLDGGFGGEGRKGEGRRGFWDARGKRREYEEWARKK
ncbi:magnesium transporter [Phaeosphaeria sp. MPI-PUGE-AT-0046c]|nr:magnesium transporter [Phaeosphaeria sp. MPI-PUGE-AT-0046c]